MCKLFGWAWKYSILHASFGLTALVWSLANPSYAVKSALNGQLRELEELIIAAFQSVGRSDRVWVDFSARLKCGDIMPLWTASKDADVFV